MFHISCICDARFRDVLFCLGAQTADRERYLSAMHTLYSIDQDTGTRRYGSNFKSAAWLVREHLYGAADKACDHWHDDAGIMNHHIGITWQLEQSMQTVDSSVAAHYWDYTIDAAGESPFLIDRAGSPRWWPVPCSPRLPTHKLSSQRGACGAPARLWFAVETSAGVQRTHERTPRAMMMMMIFVAAQTRT
jgi:hypothetical protein